jgi:transcriptional regulator with XRE-family HTH domain
MIKRAMKPADGGMEAGPCGGGVWSRVSRQLRRRRTQLGFDVDHVASHLEVSPAIYEGYEGGVQAPAFMLSQIADLFGVPVVSFFQDVAREAAEGDDTETAQPAVYRVATPEYREQVLTEYFRGLDLEDQQHLLAISKALSQAKSRKGGGARAAR